MNSLKTGAVVALLSALSLTCITPVFAADDYDDYESDYVNPDPWERFNRVTFRFNDTLDRYAVKPVAKGYKAVTPEFMRDGIGNVFHNLQEPMNFVNNTLQGKFNEAGVDMSRFLFNTLLGGLGAVDVATRMGLERNDEDLGQTLGYWGVESGPYLMLPFIGPNTLRDTASKLPENFFNYTYTGGRSLQLMASASSCLSPLPATRLPWRRERCRVPRSGAGWRHQSRPFLRRHSQPGPANLCCTSCAPASGWCGQPRQRTALR